MTYDQLTELTAAAERQFEFTRRKLGGDGLTVPQRKALEDMYLMAQFVLNNAPRLAALERLREVVEELRDYQQLAETYHRVIVKLYDKIDAALAKLTPTT